MKRYHAQKSPSDVDSGEEESAQCADEEEIVEKEDERTVKEDERVEVVNKEAEGHRQQPSLPRSTHHIRRPARFKHFVM